MLIVSNKLFLCQNDPQQHELDAGLSFPLVLPLQSSKSRELVDTQMTLSVQIIPWNPIHNLPLTRIGTYLLSLTPKPKDINPKLIYQVSYSIPICTNVYGLF